MKQRLILEHLGGDLLALRSLLDNIGGRLTPSVAPTASEYVEQSAGRVWGGGVVAPRLAE